jgi:trehalose 6-phosphate synthase/phosphatase
MGRLIIAANRLPISVSKREGEFRATPSPGGLAAGLASLPDSLKRVWIGWPGVSSEFLGAPGKERIREELAGTDCVPVFLSQSQIDQYYLGFCNQTIWPLFHYFLVRTAFVQDFWTSYKQVNGLFCDEMMKIVEPGDSVCCPSCCGRKPPICRSATFCTSPGLRRSCSACSPGGRRSSMACSGPM